MCALQVSFLGVSPSLFEWSVHNAMSDSESERAKGSMLTLVNVQAIQPKLQCCREIVALEGSRRQEEHGVFRNAGLCRREGHIPKGKFVLIQSLRPRSDWICSSD